MAERNLSVWELVFRTPGCAAIVSLTAAQTCYTKSSCDELISSTYNELVKVYIELPGKHILLVKVNAAFPGKYILLVKMYVECPDKHYL